ncbi:hypothetical protein FYJ78_03140 [Selenomonas sp. WCA-380-WT-3B 3/]|uniref:IrrE N-terminal-like domain-containing protein n=1 Tax=Selenomonas montiformis TaxID=2652285 RepID=A0A6I2UV15_9FIRM|nr:hypothetical protein [Selenomonas montiformis]MSV24195.1 hypothetical protein [Selenomonas montiformis]
MIVTRFMDLPCSIKAFSRSNADGSYTVIINACLCREQQEESYRHEVEHILNQDFTAPDSADHIESYRHKMD